MQESTRPVPIFSNIAQAASKLGIARYILLFVRWNGTDPSGVRDRTEQRLNADSNASAQVASGLVERPDTAATIPSRAALAFCASISEEQNIGIIAEPEPHHASLLTDQSITIILLTMARPREFDRDAALGNAISAFAEHGYEGTSTDQLLEAMSINRQSLYNAFGDKRRLYLEALRTYAAESTAEQMQALNSGSPLGGIEAMLNAFIRKPSNACLGVSAICEFGHSDPEVAMLNDTAARVLQAALERRISAGKASGEIDGGVDETAAARFLSATLSGIRIAARAGASPDSLRDVAQMALRSLT